MLEKFRCPFCNGDSVRKKDSGSECMDCGKHIPEMDCGGMKFTKEYRRNRQRS